MPTLLAVAAGGALGAMARYLLVAQVAVWAGRGFPWGTLSVNVLGSALIGVLWVIVSRNAAAGALHHFAIVGFLGAFTTFSAFSLELLVMLEAGRLVQAVSYVLGSVLTCLLGTFLGVSLARALTV